MVAHEPDGQTIGAARENARTKVRATRRAGPRWPELNAGWPQQTCACGKSTSKPAPSRRETASATACGNRRSPRHVAKSWTLAMAVRLYVPPTAPAPPPAARARRLPRTWPGRGGRCRLAPSAPSGDDPAVIYPKIELHVHLEGTVRPRTLFEIGRRNGVPLPADSPEGLQELFRFSDLEHFIETWFLVTAALRTADDFRRITVDYAEEAGRHGAVYVEAIFAPTVPARNGIPLQAMFEGYCDGVQEAREQLGIEVRLTPDLNRTSSLEEATRIVRAAIAHRERGVVAVGLGGIESQAPPEAYAEVFRLARDGGLGSVPHAGEVVGPPSVWGALETLRADRIRHGIRSMEDPALVRELAARGTVLDV